MPDPSSSLWDGDREAPRVTRAHGGGDGYLMRWTKGSRLVKKVLVSPTLPRPVMRNEGPVRPPQEGWWRLRHSKAILCLFSELAPRSPAWAEGRGVCVVAVSCGELGDASKGWGHLRDQKAR